MTVFNEESFINIAVDKYIKDGFDTILCLFLEDFVEKYTDNNTIIENIIIINNYHYSIYDTIQLFEFYYNYKFEFTGTKINYAELASIVLYHSLYDKLLNIIIDAYDSSNDTDYDDNDNDKNF